MPRPTKQERLDALVSAFTELGPAWGRWLNATMPGPGTSYIRLRLLHALECHADRAMTMTELARALDITQRRVTALVDALESDGLVARTPHPTDGRSTIVTLTRKGLAQQKATWEQRQTEIGRAFADLSPAHQTQLLEITPLLTDALRRRAAERPSPDGDGCD
jgi:DNA-binding MarR family transcriptional regulator